MRMSEEIQEMEELFVNTIQYFEEDVLKQLLFMIADILGIDEDVKELIKLVGVYKNVE